LNLPLWYNAKGVCFIKKFLSLQTFKNNFMNNIAEVYQSLQRKKSIEAEAERLGITVDDYVAAKDQISEILRERREDIADYISDLATGSDKTKSNIDKSCPTKELLLSSKVIEVHENVEEGTSKITALSSTEPKSAEEIISILKLDTTKWKLSQYWNKEKHDKWLVSALVTRVKEEERAIVDLYQILSDRGLPEFEAVKPEDLQLNRDADERVCGVMSFQDLHFGKLDNDDIAEQVFNAAKYLISKAYLNYHLEKIIFVIGGDILNMDTFHGTTTKGTVVENGMTAPDAYILAFDTVCRIVNLFKQYTEDLEIVFIPGNHDRLSSFHLLHAVSQAFYKERSITFNTKYEERKVLQFGVNMFAVEHGDVTAKNNPLVYATEFPEIWGQTLYRTLYTGHYHYGKTKEYITENGENGFVTKIIPALTAGDYYHHHNKYTGSRRSALIHLHDANKGLVSEFTYSI
jgi:hypothetical protein